VEQLELGGSLARVEELDVLDHEQPAAVAEAPLEFVRATRLDRVGEVVRERLGRRVDHARLAVLARLVHDRAREMRLAEPLRRGEHERVERALRSPRDRERCLARERVAGADHEVVEAIRELALRSGRIAPIVRRGCDRGPSGFAGLACGLCRGRRSRAQRRRNHQVDRDRRTRLERGAALDLGEEALAHAVAVERRGTAQRQSRVRSAVLGCAAARYERSDPRFQGKGGHLCSEAAKDAVPEPRGG
jgi:hypothetical protein